MDYNHEILTTVRSIKNLLESNQTDYCDSDEASRIIAVTNKRDLKYLHDIKELPRYPRGNGFVYKKKDCYKVAAKLDDKTIIIPPKDDRNKKSSR